jgi:VWFA-related protein
MTRTFLSVALLLTLSSVEVRGQTSSGGAQSPQPLPTFSSEVELVTVDAVVVDKQGKPLTGLRKEDFVLTEDGVPQPIESFEAVVLPVVPPPTEAPRHPPVADNMRVEARSGRVFAVVFDDMHLSPRQAHRAKKVVAEFLRQGAQEGDRVVIVTTSGGAAWSARMEADREELMNMLKRLEGRRVREGTSIESMTDYEALRIIQYHDALVGQRVQQRFDTAGLLTRMQDDKDPTNAYRSAYGISHPYIAQRAQELYQDSRIRNRLTLLAMRRILEGLATVRGRKSMVLVSEGFVDDPAASELHEVVSAARMANVAVYFIDTRGLEGTSDMFSAEFGPAPDIPDVNPLLGDISLESRGSEEIASETGGFSLKDTNDLAGGITRISNELRAYYLLGYYPKQSVADGGFHKVEVRANRKNVVVRARRGYYAPDAAREGERPKEDEGIDPAKRRAVDAPAELEGIPLRLTAVALGETLMGRAKVLIAADIDLRGMAFEKQGDRLVDKIDLLLFVTHRESGEVTQYPETLETRLRPQTLERNPWYPLVRDFDLGSGTYQAKLVVRDQQGRRLGSVLHAFSVPALDQLRASTPILSATVKPDPDDPATPRPVLQVSRVFPARGTLYCQLDVYNAQKDPQTGKAQVTHGFALRAKDGHVVREADPTPIKPSPKGGISRLLGIPLDGLAAGDYDLEIHLKDELAGKTLDLSEPLSLETPPAS